ncbi:acetyltransferase [Microdochium trichocladiopsis]|uniref:Acetyltransferase n=1 Tax=Microdochium trichocladiopsis TaxID=1682393 RepID=A0A9P8XWV2_9PEZI|nr:acetyltransferase [Microdochium trichocladiopsis]KAH7021381.1 acetyltransferase [Microdochium trichocladiopsis]
MASSQPPLVLEPCTLDDMPLLSAVWFAAFTDPGLRRLWPDTPLVRAWWDRSNTSDFVHRADRQVFLKVVDPSTLDPATNRPRIAAYAKWDLCTPEERGSRYPPWCADMPGDECEVFFAREEQERQRVMGGERHYYLDTLATHPDYQRRGAGSMLVRWGVARAEHDGVGVYLDASKEGAPLYAKCGFADESLPGAGDVASMAIHRRS